ncbi:WD40 repeat domain-containing protein [Streptomyces sp. NBC_01439]|uniref:WD40 repeat domain-containing protein n=1 Tax=Streptomyces sp. NBC_01439 TaxID=2903867 RepID=UPI002E2E5B82|nr:WD40 repeat domain-containing protein [Streptomyces sp. NBC_01439]
MFSPDGRTLAVGQGGSLWPFFSSDTSFVETWSVDDGHRLARMTAPGVLDEVVFADQGRALVTRGRTGTVERPSTYIQLWKPGVGDPLTEPLGGDHTFHIGVADGGTSLLVIGRESDGVAVRNAVDRQAVRRLTGPSAQWVSSAVLSPDGRFVATMKQNSRMQLWQVSDGRPSGGDGSVHEADAFFSGDSRVLAVVTKDRKQVEVWDTRDGRIKSTLETGDDGMSTVLLSPDGSKAVTRSYSDLQLCDTANGRRIGSPPADAEPDSSLSASDDAVARFTPDGRTLATASQDETVRLWRLDTLGLRDRAGLLGAR